MSALLGRLRYFLTDAADEWRHSPGPNFLAATTLAAILFVAGSVLLVLRNAQVHLEGWRGSVRVSVFLRDDATTEARDAIRRRLEPLPGVAQVDYVTKDEALRRFRGAFGDLAELSAELQSNPLPASLEAFLAPAPDSSAVARSIAAAVAGQPGVEEVRYDRDWLDRFDASLGMARRVAAGLAVLVLGAVTLVMAGVLRLAVYARREEIEIMLLVGASPGFARGPFLVAGLGQGLVASLASLLLVEGTRVAGIAAAGQNPAGLLDMVAGQPLPGRLSALIVLAGLAVGAASSLFAVRGKLTAD